MSKPTIKMLVPQLRFPEFSEEWEPVRLGQLGTFKSGVRFAESEQGGRQGTPFYKVLDMNLRGNESSMIVANNYVTDEQITRLGYKPIKQDAIIFAKVGAAVFLERKWQARDFLLDNTMMAFLAGPKIDPSYSSVLFLIIRLSKFARVGVFPSYHGSDLATIKLFLPTLPEQQKIADCLSSLDELTTAHTQKYDALVAHKNGLMQKLFSRELRFKDAQGKDFPDWVEKKAGDVFHTHTNKNHNGDLPILAATQDRGVIPRTETELDIKSLEKNIVLYKIIEPGDFVISPRSFQGGIEYSEYLGISRPEYIVLKPAIEIVDAFFKFLFKKEDFISQLNNTVIGASIVKQIPDSAFSALKLLIPSLPEQQKIADCLSSIDDLITVQAQKVESIKAHKKGLMQQLFPATDEVEE